MYVCSRFFFSFIIKYLNVFLRHVDDLLVLNAKIYRCVFSGLTKAVLCAGRED